MIDLSFYKNRKVLVTGHTGFKGTWLCTILVNAGAKVTGYSMEPNTEPDLFSISGIKEKMNSLIGDIRDLDALNSVFDEVQPEIVLHLAAQPIVRESYKNPVYTYETNVMGTVNICECVRTHDCVKSFVNVTTDKVYENKEWIWGYREDEPLNGYDPYSNSKSCSELVTQSYMLEPLFAYLTIAKEQYPDISKSGHYNVGPDDCDCVSTGRLADIFCASWGEGIKWINKHDGGPHEASFLKLDCSKIKAVLGWKPKWGIQTAVDKIVEWTKAYEDNKDVYEIMIDQINEYNE